jgi:hypothetical protein
MANAAAKYAKLKKQMEAARKEMANTAAKLFKEMSAELFEENPELVSFSWTQYTPYFNDGDVCEFSCHGDYPSVSIKVGDDVIGYDENRGDLEINGEEVQSTYDLERQFKDLRVDSFRRDGKEYTYDKTTKTILIDGVKIPTYDDYSKQFDSLGKKVSAFLNAFEDEDMETMFGDHKKVTVTRDGEVEAESYEHD